MREESSCIYAEECQVRMLVDHCSKIYVWATNGQISKPTTEPSTVIAVAEDVREDEIQEIIKYGGGLQKG